MWADPLFGDRPQFLKINVTTYLILAYNWL